MVLINTTTMQATAKVVYYGPGLGGKTTNLQHIHAHTEPGSRGEMVSLETEADRTLFFDLLPLEVGIVGGLRVRLQVYTVPGQVFYNETRRLVLKAADAIVFVADSQSAAREANLESLRNLALNLGALGEDLSRLPLVFQYNKRDLKDVLPVAELEAELNPEGRPFVEAVAIEGRGVFETLRTVSRLALADVRRKVEAEAPRRPKSSRRPRAEAPEAKAATPAEETPRDALELTERALVRVPRKVLAHTRDLGVHLSFQGGETSLRDVALVPLAEPVRSRLRLRLEIEIEADD
jgi:mutual gliding-motility protein MglA